MSATPDSFLPTQPPQRTTALSLREAAMLQTGVLRDTAADVADDSLDIKALLRILNKYKWVLVAFALLGLAVSLVKTLTSTPLYQASATVQIERPPGRIVSFNRDVDSSQDYDDYLALPTQIELLRSRALAERVIDELNLDPARSQAPAPGVLGGAQASASAPRTGAASAAASAAGGQVMGGPRAAASKAERDAPWWAFLSDLKDRTVAGYDNLGKPAVSDKQVLGREAVVGGFMGSVKVEAVKGSRLVRINVVGTDPARAARVANAMAENFMAMSMERKMESSIYARNFLQDQIKVSKARLEESERTLNSYARANSILTLDEKTSVINQTFTDYSSALSKAEQERVKAEAQYREMERNPENSVQVLENKSVQAYKEQKAKLEAEYLVNLGVYKPDFPKMVQTKVQITELELRIKAEIAAVLASVKAQYDAAKRQEDQVRARLQETRKEVIQTQDKGVDLSLLKRELDTNRQIYDNLLQRLKEVGVTAGVAANNISVVDTAKAPLFPFKPDMSVNAAIGLAVGLMLGLGLVFLREHMDDSIKHADELEPQFGVPLLGIIPKVKKSKRVEHELGLLAVDDPRGSFAEAYRSMRTALQFSTSDGAPSRLMVTSSVASEGKSTTALALAINFAQLGKRVLLIDADMRNPSLHKSLDLSNDRGLSNYLSGEGTRDSLIRPCSVPNLKVMTAGPMPPSPVDLLMGPRLLGLLDKAEELGYEQVVIDAPPILGIADALVLGNQIQSLLFVVKAGSTRRSSIRDALRRLRTAGLLPLGMVLARATSEHSSYYGYEGYYGYGNSKATEGGGGAAAGPAGRDRLDRRPA
jgi:succinoglycan biosynthesis transport protein ExoP